MGTWDIGYFDNDMACDWENEIESNMNLSYITDALNPVITNSEDSLDVDLANKALAASETLARLLNRDGERNSYTKHVDKWVDDFNEIISDDLIELALKSITKILSKDSELNQFWSLRGEFDTWSDSIRLLQERLKKK